MAANTCHLHIQQVLLTQRLQVMTIAFLNQTRRRCLYQETDAVYAERRTVAEISLLTEFLVFTDAV